MQSAAKVAYVRKWRKIREKSNEVCCYSATQLYYYPTAFNGNPPDVYTIAIKTFKLYLRFNSETY